MVRGINLGGTDKTDHQVTILLMQQPLFLRPAIGTMLFLP